MSRRPSNRVRRKTFVVDGMSVVAESRGEWLRRLVVVLAHGAGNGMDSDFMRAFASDVVDVGAVAVRFNFPYMEAGRRAPDPQSRLEAAYRSVVAKVIEEFDPEVLVIGGKSMGGRIASSIAADLDAVKALVYLGYPLHPPGRPERMRDRHLYAIDRPMLFISGTRDSFATPDRIATVVGRIGSTAVLETIEGGDHSFKRRKRDPGAPGEEEARRVFRNWLDRLRPRA